MDTLHDPTSDTEAVRNSSALIAYWLDRLDHQLGLQVAASLGQDIGQPPGADQPPLDAGSALARQIAEMDLTPDEVLLLVLALAPQARPDLFDTAVARAGASGHNLELLGGLRGKQHRGMLPTGDTALFVLAGQDIEPRLIWQSYLMGQGQLMADGVVRLDAPPPYEPPMSGRLTLDPDLAERILTGRNAVPRASAEFPAQLLRTEMAWSDLVLPAQCLDQIQELLAWIEHGRTVLDDWGMRAKLRPGCRVVFYGPPGTGKTLSAALLGKLTGREVLRIDLSRVVSKYIGETEKNLAAILDKAERKDWILFFDEADALFGKRSAVKEAKDRYANQEIAFLLQRIEVFDGMVVLCSNLPGNVDEAFSRRFEHVIHFPLPKSGERRLLWEKALPAKTTLEPSLKLSQLSDRYELSGGSIINVVRHAALKAAQAGRRELHRADMIEGVRREMAKEGRSA